MSNFEGQPAGMQSDCPAAFLFLAIEHMSAYMRGITDSTLGVSG